MQDATGLLEEIHHLMTLKGENPFKIRAFEKAIHELSGRTDLLERARAGTLTELEGIGKGISEVLTEFLLHGKSSTRDELAAAVPPELLELTRVPGLGPKKAMELIENLGIKTLTELEYACRENRLLKFKGFGEKTQKKILEGVQFLKAHQGELRLVDALPLKDELLALLTQELQKNSKKLRLSETGAVRRQTETVDEISFLVEIMSDAKDAETLKRNLEKVIAAYRATNKTVVRIWLFYSEAEKFGYELARTTGSADHWKALDSPKPCTAADEAAFFKKRGLPLIPPEMRETGEEIELAKKGKLDTLLPWDGVQGVFHNHTLWSDGVNSTEEMVLEARRLGYKYIGISDHSQSAFYAQGLKTDDLKKQEKEIRHVQEKYPDIRVFWGVESDILADGSLDYNPEVLKKFDFVIASVHSRFQMDRKAMTDRILKAIRNPYTRFVGHITGRLLLGRKGYDVDMEALIKEAAAHDVAIEINANPARLDIDWRFGKELRKHKTLVSINPDAHEVHGLRDTQFGVAMARKALMPTGLVVNSRSVKEVEKWLKRG